MDKSKIVASLKKSPDPTTGGEETHYQPFQ